VRVVSAERRAPAAALAPAERRRHGRYFTPRELVDFTFELASPWLPRSGPIAILDPACGTGAFLLGARRFRPAASLFGLEISSQLARRCRETVPEACILTGDALRGGAQSLVKKIPVGAFEFWTGNPPYNGTSSILQDKRAYARLKALLGAAFALPKGTSLRDDYAFFLLFAAARLARVEGALAFVTSATLLDSFLYAPLRGSLLGSLALQEVVDLGPSIFAGTRVRTCVTLWTSARNSSRARFRLRKAAREGKPFRRSDLGPAALLDPRPPEYLLRFVNAAAQALDAQWRRQGEVLSILLPISFPGLKTRFDELLVDETPDRLLSRLNAFVKARADGLASFAAVHAIPEHCLEKLRRLHLAVRGLAIDPAKVRPFLRYAGSRHRAGIPASARAFCFLDRRFIPRGDHRLRGDYDPHACSTKLVYNTRELPMSALLIQESACLHDHRHSRFAPLVAPSLLIERGLRCARSGLQLGPDAPNLSPAGLALAVRSGGALAVFRRIADFINSREVQEIWSPVYGTTRELPVPVQRWIEEPSPLASTRVSGTA
jgi:hypothetical protein